MLNISIYVSMYYRVFWSFYFRVPLVEKCQPIFIPLIFPAFFKISHPGFALKGVDFTVQFLVPNERRIKGEINQIALYQKWWGHFLKRNIVAGKMESPKAKGESSVALRKLKGNGKINFVVWCQHLERKGFTDRLRWDWKSSLVSVRNAC